MKKTLFIIMLVCLTAIGCTKEASINDTPAVDTGNTVTAEAPAAQETAAPGKAEAKAPKAQKAPKRNAKTAVITVNGEKMEVPTSVDTKTIKASDIPADGVISRTAVISKDKDAPFSVLAVTQKVTAYRNQWDPEVMDYFVNIEVKPELGEDMEHIWWDEKPEISVKCADKNSIAPVDVDSFEILSEDRAKWYDHTDVPFDWIDLKFQIRSGNEVLAPEGETGTFALALRDFAPWAEEEAERPYLYGTVKQKLNGILCHPEDDISDYWTEDNFFLENVEVPDPNSWFGYRNEMRARYYFTVTEKGYELFDAFCSTVVYDDLLGTPEWEALKEELGEDDIGFILEMATQSLSLNSCFDRVLDQFKDWLSEEQLWNCLDPDKLESFKADAERDRSSQSEADWKAIYSID